MTLVVKNLPANAGDARDMGQEDPLEEKNGTPLQYPCLEKSHGQRSLWATVHGGCREPDMTEL